MAIELKQSLKLSQQLVITPQLQQAIKLLQLSRLELADLLQKELLENPVLEEVPATEDEEAPKGAVSEGDGAAASAPDKSHDEQPEVLAKDGELKEPKEFDWENYMENTYNAPGEGYQSRQRTEEVFPFENVISKAETLVEHLEWQLRMSPLSEKEEEIGVTLIGALDDDGYLRVPLEELAGKNGFEVACAEKVLDEIQSFDPTGVGARDLEECLLLQIGGEDDQDLLSIMISDHLHLLEKNDFKAISRKMKIPFQQVIDLSKIIHDLEPRPGRAFGGAATQYITPDVYVVKVGEDYSITLNEEGLPRLKLSPFYQKMLKDKSSNGSKTGIYVQEKLKSAVWLIKSIHQRQRTLYRVSRSIVSFQKEFLDKGVEHLKPMVLKDVADEIGMHESTVSRATSNKYMHTPQGIFELKYFFSGSVGAGQGTDVASEAVKEKIRVMIGRENVRSPLSDKDIALVLKNGNIEIARRTVAKYREMMGILPSSKRKQVYSLR